jgi:large subunit ribosomal protein L19
MANLLNWRETTKISSGDTIRVHQTVVEGSKTRSQIFEGIVIRIRGHKGLKSFTVRKIGANGIGVEKIFPENTPTVTKIDVKKLGKVRRANLSYLRDRVGRKATKIKDVFVKGAGKLEETATEAVTKTVKERPEAEAPKAKKVFSDAKMEAKKEARKARQATKKKKVDKKEKVFVR